MSKLPSFLVGLAVSSVGYTYLSRQLVSSRNNLMMTQFKAEGVEPYYPVRRAPRGFGRPQNRRGWEQEREGAGPPPTSTPPSQAEHPLVTDARRKWNAAVFRCSDFIVSAVYGGGAKSKPEQDPESSESTASR